MDKAERPKRSFIMQIVFSSVIAVLISLVLILICSFIIVSANLSDAWLGPIKQIVKAISIFLGCLFGFKGRSDGWKKGLCTGLLYSVLAVIIFSLMDVAAFAFSLSMLWDVLFGLAMGLICGIIVVNLKKER